MTGLIGAALVAAGLTAVGLTAARRSARPPTGGRGARLLRAAARLLLLAAGAFLVARAGYILATEHPGRPETYRHVWGGPHWHLRRPGCPTWRAPPNEIAAARRESDDG